jgi:hypothetical protein
MRRWIGRCWRLISPLRQPKDLGRLNTFVAQSDVQKRVASPAMHTEPYPYFVADDVLPAHVLQEVYDHWPSRSQFAPEIAHTYTCELLYNRIFNWRQRRFWNKFCKTYGRAIAAAAVIQFRPWIAARYGDDIMVQLARISLMESDPQYAGHGCHTHHYHDPGWVGTLLLYLDRDATGYPGTTIQRFDDVATQAQARMAASTLEWHAAPGMSEVATVPYAQNRLFAFLDSPISYHSVHRADPNAVGHRRIFRIHLTVPASAIEKIYGMSHLSYMDKRRRPTDDPEVVGWLASEIEQMREQSHRYQSGVGNRQG